MGIKDADHDAIIKAVVAGESDLQDELRKIGLAPNAWWKLAQPRERFMLDITSDNDGRHCYGGSVQEALQIASGAQESCLLRPMDEDERDDFDSRNCEQQIVEEDLRDQERMRHYLAKNSLVNIYSI